MGCTPTDDDYGPALEWEAPLWQQYIVMSNQWRVGPQGRAGIDLNAWYPVITYHRWDLNIALQLLSSIENAYYEHTANDRPEN